MSHCSRHSRSLIPSQRSSVSVTLPTRSDPRRRSIHSRYRRELHLHRRLLHRQYPPIRKLSSLQYLSVTPNLPTPSQTINKLLSGARYHSPPEHGTALCMLTSRNTAGITIATRPPIPFFRAPFQGSRLWDLHCFVMQNCPRGPWSTKGFVVLDEQTTVDETVEVVALKLEPPFILRTVRCGIWEVAKKIEEFEPVW